MISASHEVTRLLRAWGNGDEAALARLAPLVEAELHKLAGVYLRRERPGHTLQTTALVNEAYPRLIDDTVVQWQNRAHFYGIAAQLMRRILVDHARRRRKLKRGGNPVRVSLAEVDRKIADESSADIIALDAALSSLSQFDARKESDCRAQVLRRDAGGSDCRSVEDLAAHRAARMESGARVAV